MGWAALAALVGLSAAEAADAPPAGPTPEARATAEGLIAVALKSNLAYDIVESLTTEVGPRPGGSPAEARARDWAVAKLTALGFKNVRVDPFEVDYWVRGAEKAEVTAPYPQSLVVSALGRSVATPEEGLEAEVARLGSFEALIALPPGGLAGKIAFIDEPMVRTMDGSGYGAAVRKRARGPSEAAKRGAVALVIRSAGTDNSRFPHTGALTYADSAPKVPAGALAAPDADLLARMIARGKPVRLRLTLTPSTRDKAPSGNVLGEIVGRGAPKEIVLLACHLDSWDVGTGALDDGAGCGIVIAAAKLIGSLPKPPRRTIRVFLAGNEERGLEGGKDYPLRYKDQLADHVIAAESDFGAGRIWRLDGRVGEDRLPVLRALGEVLAPLGVLAGRNDARGGADIGDLRKAGVPVVSLVQDGAEYFDYHHTDNDTLDKIDPEALKQNVAVYAAFAYLAAEQDGGFHGANWAAPVPASE